MQDRSASEREEDKSVTGVHVKETLAHKHESLYIRRLEAADFDRYMCSENKDRDCVHQALAH